MPPKCSETQIDEKLQKLRAFVYGHAALLASRNGSSSRASFRQKASADEKWWYMLSVRMRTFSESQKNSSLQICAFLPEQSSLEPCAPASAALPEHAPEAAAMLPEPPAEAAAVLPEPTAEVAAALPEPAAEAVAVLPVLPVLEEPELPTCKKPRLVPTDVLAALQTGRMLN